MKIVASCFLFLVSLQIKAMTISCSHSELCTLVENLTAESSHNTIKTEVLVHINGDPHEYEPSTSEIKSLLNSPFLITGPNELNPWIKKINAQRAKNQNLKTISLQLDKNDTKNYGENLEALSHFWLYPEIFCSLEEKLSSELKKLGISTLTKKCLFQQIESELTQALLQTKKPIILTHDALLPLLLKLHPAHVIVSLKGSGHHQEVSTDSIKKMYQAQKTSSVLWIVEKGIDVPQNILNKIRSSDDVIYLDTAHSKDSKDFSILSELSAKLKGLSKK